MSSTDFKWMPTVDFTGATWWDYTLLVLCAVAFIGYLYALWECAQHVYVLFPDDPEE